MKSVYFIKKKKSLKIKFYNIDCFYEEKTLVLDLMIDILLNNWKLIVDLRKQNNIHIVKI